MSPGAWLCRKLLTGPRWSTLELDSRGAAHTEYSVNSMPPSGSGPWVRARTGQRRRRTALCECRSRKEPAGLYRWAKVRGPALGATIARRQRSAQIPTRIAHQVISCRQERRGPRLEQPAAFLHGRRTANSSWRTCSVRAGRTATLPEDQDSVRGRVLSRVRLLQARRTLPSPQGQAVEPAGPYGVRRSCCVRADVSRCSSLVAEPSSSLSGQFSPTPPAAGLKARKVAGNSAIPEPARPSAAGVSTEIKRRHQAGVRRRSDDAGGGAPSPRACRRAAGLEDAPRLHAGEGAENPTCALGRPNPGGDGRQGTSTRTAGPDRRRAGQRSVRPGPNHLTRLRRHLPG